MAIRGFPAAGLGRRDIHLALRARQRFDWIPTERPLANHLLLHAVPSHLDVRTVVLLAVASKRRSRHRGLARRSGPWRADRSDRIARLGRRSLDLPEALAA